MEITDIDKLEPDDNYFKEIHDNVWLTDNHKWAFYIWEHYLNKTGIDQLGLVHIDYHWDSTDDISDKKLESVVKNWKLSDIEIQTRIKHTGPIRWDSFIAPFVYRGRVPWIKWLCIDEDEDPGFSGSLSNKFDFTEEFFDSADQLSSSDFNNPFIFDLCLDYFTMEGDGIDNKLRDDDFIEIVLNDCEFLIKNSELVTISLSFVCFPNYDDTRYLAKKILPEIINIRNN